MDPSQVSELSLMFIGMSTVFLILGIIYVSGNLLVHFTNKMSDKAVDDSSVNDDLSKDLVIISAAVTQITQGAGSVTSISRIKN